MLEEEKTIFSIKSSRKKIKKILYRGQLLILEDTLVFTLTLMCGINYSSLSLINLPDSIIQPLIKIGFSQYGKVIICVIIKLLLE